MICDTHYRQKVTAGVDLGGASSFKIYNKYHNILHGCCAYKTLLWLKAHFTVNKHDRLLSAD